MDRWVGVPLVFLCTLLLRISRFLRTSRPVKPSRILFIELSEMGSVILADPAMRKAQRVFHADVFFVIFARNASILKLIRTVPDGNVFTIRDNNLFAMAADVAKLCLWTRRNRIDTAVDFELFSRFSALLSWLSGAAIRCGFFSFHNEGLYRGDVLTHRVIYNPHIHIAKNFIALINALSATHDERPYSKTTVTDDEIAPAPFACRKADITSLRARLAGDFGLPKDPCHSRLVLLNPYSGPALPQRNWPPENFASLARMILARDMTAVVLVTGTPETRDDAQRLVDRVDDKRCVNVSGLLRVEELPLLYAASIVMVTNDSGPSHFAAVTPLPTVVLFGPETPALYGSLGRSIPIHAGLACSPCVSATNHRKTPCRDNVCLQMITPAMVFEKVTPFLFEPPIGDGHMRPAAETDAGTFVALRG